MFRFDRSCASWQSVCFLSSAVPWNSGRILAGVALVAAIGCEGPQSALAPAGRDAERIASLFWIMTAGALVVWTAVVLVAVYAIRSRRDTHSHATANLLIMGGGVALPAVVLAALLAYGMPVLSAVIAPAPEGALVIDVTAKQWWWRVRYRNGDAAIETANEIHLPVGQRIELRLESADVIHSFWVPSLAGKVDMFPGRVTRLALEPTRTGVFRGTCAEYCGEAHAKMGLTVVVTTLEEFRTWLERQARPAPAAAAMPDGETAFLSNGCGACHSVRGRSANGRIGPDLTHVGGRAAIAAGMLDLTAENIAQWIAAADRLKPGVHMPAFRTLPPDQVRSIAHYLAELR
jgi:cytochrome c oxidase subunit II